MTSAFPTLRPWFIDTINKNAGKEIVFVIDFSSRMSKLEKYVKMFAKNILGVVDAKDKVSAMNSIELLCLRSWQTSVRKSLVLFLFLLPATFSKD